MASKSKYNSLFNLWLRRCDCLSVLRALSNALLTVDLAIHAWQIIEPCYQTLKSKSSLHIQTVEPKKLSLLVVK